MSTPSNIRKPNRDLFVLETLALQPHIPFFFIHAGGYQEPMEEKLIPLHLRTFEIAAEVNENIAPDRLSE